MGVFLGGLSSLLYGVADFLGGEAARRAPAPAVVLGAGMVSFPLITVAALGFGGDGTASDFAMGGLAGAVGAFGLTLLFMGLARGHAAAVAPASAVFGAILPVVVAVVLGERPTPLAWVGVALAVPSIVLCSWVADAGDVPLGGLGYGLAAGLGFGTYTILISRTAEASNLLPLIPARFATMLVVLSVGLAGVWRLSAIAIAPKRLVAANGVLDVAGNVTLLLGLRSGSLALVAVAASVFPAVTVVLARMVNHEHLRARQVAGLVMTLAALALIALG
jgi:uncharacterized membrane protein